MWRKDKIFLQNGRSSAFAIKIQHDSNSDSSEMLLAMMRESRNLNKLGLEDDPLEQANASIPGLVQHYMEN